MRAPDEVNALRMRMKKMQSMLHELENPKIWSLGFRIFLLRQWPSQEPRIQKPGV